jgi:hypothetical protein
VPKTIQHHLFDAIVDIPEIQEDFDLFETLAHANEIFQSRVLLRIGRASVSIRRLVQFQLGRPQLNEAASGSKAGPAESYRIGKAFC